MPFFIHQHIADFFSSVWNYSYKLILVPTPIVCSILWISSEPRQSLNAKQLPNLTPKRFSILAISSSAQKDSTEEDDFACAQLSQKGRHGWVLVATCEKLLYIVRVEDDFTKISRAHLSATEEQWSHHVFWQPSAELPP